MFGTVKRFTVSTLTVGNRYKKQEKKTEHYPLNTRKRKDFPFKFSVPFACLAGKIFGLRA